MRVYVDSSALIKRVIAEPQSDAVEAALGRHVSDGSVLVSSSLAWIEVTRAIRARVPDDQVNTLVEDALSGLAERTITPEVVSMARRVDPRVLRTLDAIHLATAILVDADMMLTYDGRLADAARHAALAVVAP